MAPITEETPSALPDDARRYTARDALLVVTLAAVLLVVLVGDGVRRAGEKMDPGIIRSVTLAVGHPAGWVADQLPFAAAADQVTGWLSEGDEDLSSDDESFTAAPVAGGEGDAGAGRVPVSAFSDGRKRVLRSLLVTGDSLSQPLDAQLARTFADRGVRTDRDARIGTGISQTDLVDWGKLAIQQTGEVKPDAVVMFIGANEGFPLPGSAGTVECCGPAWKAEYATRARAMMRTYGRSGATKVFWVLVPAPRDAGRRRISAAVNEAIRVAAGPFGAEVQIVDAAAIFTPGYAFRDAMALGGRRQIVRQSDGIHLNDRGSELLTDIVERLLLRTFRTP
jgi:hypothetical protein